MSDTFSIAFIVPAAGRGQRLGAPINKVLMPVGNRPLLAHTLSALAAAAAELAPVQTIIVIGAGDVTAVRETVLPTVPGSERLGPLIVVPGGSSRQASVLCGLEAAGDAEWVLVHDGARPLVTPALILETVAAAVDAGAAAAAAPLVDTIKRVDAAGFIQATVPREGLWAVETPQVFRRTELIEAHRQAIHEGWLVTDDAALMERLDRSVKVVPAYENNLKVTGPRDLDQIRRTLAPADSGDAVMRVGYGYDVHAFSDQPERRLVIGGVGFPAERGLAGHSDADVLVHAVIDALLGAAALGDIGTHFPDTDPDYQDADSIDLLRQARLMVSARGAQISNVDTTVVAEQPRLADRIPAMRRSLAAALDIPEHRVSVKATTSEGLGFIGAVQGIAAHAVCLLAFPAP